VFGSNLTVSGFIEGNSNSIFIGDALRESAITILVQGNENKIEIRSIVQVKDLLIRVGTHIPANKTEILIDSNFSSEWGNSFLLPNSGTYLTIGGQCLFSNSITIRCGESPHLIFDRVTGQYLDTESFVRIGSHVWVGEGSYITKRAAIANETIVAAKSVVTKKFTEQYTVLAGNPARVARRNIEWVRNPTFLEPNSTYHGRYDHWINRTNTEKGDLE
jgi:acetyltransferase-like isoleucine patch superfamily enzyme